MRGVQVSARREMRFVRLFPDRPRVGKGAKGFPNKRDNDSLRKRDVNWKKRTRSIAGCDDRLAIAMENTLNPFFHPVKNNFLFLNRRKIHDKTFPRMLLVAKAMIMINNLIDLLTQFRNN